MRLGRLRAHPPLLVFLVGLEVHLEPFDVAVAFEGEDVGGEAVEEHAVVGDHHGVAGVIPPRGPGPTARTERGISQGYDRFDASFFSPVKYGFQNAMVSGTEMFKKNTVAISVMNASSLRIGFWT